jgi:hypothetical protein
MIRILWLLRRKPGISHQSFRDHYERSHAVLGEQYLGHLMQGYRRHYVQPSASAGSPVMRQVLAAKAWDYDCVAEWDLADEAAFEQVFATLSDPEIGALFHADEEHFLDRGSVRLVLCDTCETDVSASVPGVDRALRTAQSQWDT